MFCHLRQFSTFVQWTFVHTQQFMFFSQQMFSKSQQMFSKMFSRLRSVWTFVEWVSTQHLFNLRFEHVQTLNSTFVHFNKCSFICASVQQMFIHLRFCSTKVEEISRKYYIVDIRKYLLLPKILNSLVNIEAVRRRG